MTYTVTVTNTGDSPLFLALLRDDTCQPLEYQSGNTGNLFNSSPGEAWVFTCTMVPDGDTTNTVGIFGIDPSVRPSIRRTRPTSLRSTRRYASTNTYSINLVQTGLTVTYTFTATNTGDDPLSDIVLYDDQCANRVLVDDGNGDAILDPDEVWTWTRDTAVTQETVNHATVPGTRPYRCRRRRLPARDRGDL